MDPPVSPPARIFISYSRKDGAAAAAGLRRTLLDEQFSVWQDIIALEGGRDWWSQIENALRSKTLQHFVLVVTPAALASPVVRREIRLARQEGKTVSPVKGPGLGDLGNLPRWLGQVYDLDLSEHRTTLIRVLQNQSQQARVPMMAPEPPPDFVRRPAEFNALKEKLLDAKGDAVAISAALKGAGGYGKTTLARALAHDPDVQDAYFDGILWVVLGEKPDNLLSIIADLVEILTGERPGLENVTAAAAKLGDALGDRRILLIIDDAWREQDLRPFLQGGRNTTRLITTRLSRILPQGAFRQNVDAMTTGEARELLSRGLPADQVLDQSRALGGLAMRLGEWAQLLKLANGFLCDRVVEGREALHTAIADANARLDEEGLGTFDAEDEDDRTRAVARTINLSLGLLDDGQRARLAELAVFPEDADIPVGIVARLWRRAAGLSEGRTKDLLTRFLSLSLLLNLDLSQGVLRFHDTIRRFLQDEAGNEGLVAQHRRLVEGMDDLAGSADADGTTRRYFYRYRPYHLAAAGDRETLGRLLLDPGWLQSKLAVMQDPQALVADYDQHGANETHRLIGRTMRLIPGICARDPRQLLPQFIGRLTARDDVAVSRFLNDARHCVSPPALLPLGPSLTPSGTETARIDGHTSGIDALCVLRDKRLASAHDDGRIRLWDHATGAETACIEGHASSIRTLCVLADGRLASGGGDGIRLWDPATGAETAHLKSRMVRVKAVPATRTKVTLPDGDVDSVRALCVLADGRLASGGSDGTIRLWDPATGAETACIEGHEGRGVSALCVLADGRLASGGGSDRTIRVWDLATGTETARIRGPDHIWGVTALCVLTDGRLVCLGEDSLRLWDPATDTEAGRIDCDVSRVLALCVLADGRIAFNGRDNTIQLWDPATGAETARLHGHTDLIRALCVLADGRIASSADDGTIRLWDPAASAKTPGIEEGRAGSVNALCVLADGRVVSSAQDGTIRLWDPGTRAETAHLEGHTRSVNALCVLPDGRLASGSDDHTIRLWDPATGAETGHIEDHERWRWEVNALCVLADGRFASGDRNGTIQLWDSATGTETARIIGRDDTRAATGRQRYVTLCVLADGRIAYGTYGEISLRDPSTSTETGHIVTGAYVINALCVLTDGRIASGTFGNIQLWDPATGTETGRLEGHTKSVNALCMLADGRLVSGADDRTIRLWDPVTGAELACLDVDAPVTCLTALTRTRAEPLLLKWRHFPVLSWLGLSRRRAAPGLSKRPGTTLVAGDKLGRLHWLEVVE